MALFDFSGMENGNIHTVMVINERCLVVGRMGRGLPPSDCPFGGFFLL